jgi:hypothetical protein
VKAVYAIVIAIALVGLLLAGQALAAAVVAASVMVHLILKDAAARRADVARANEVQHDFSARNHAELSAEIEKLNARVSALERNSEPQYRRSLLDDD